MVLFCKIMTCLVKFITESKNIAGVIFPFVNIKFGRKAEKR